MCIYIYESDMHIVIKTSVKYIHFVGYVGVGNTETLKQRLRSLSKNMDVSKRQHLLLI